jgi:hypothetical protein
MHSVPFPARVYSFLPDYKQICAPEFQKTEEKIWKSCGCIPIHLLRSCFSAVLFALNARSTRFSAKERARSSERRCSAVKPSPDFHYDIEVKAGGGEAVAPKTISIGYI